MRWILILTLLGTTGLQFSCSSSSQKKINLQKKNEILDSLALVYDPAQRNPDLHAFMQRLHQRSGFNGTVLIAKKGKILYQNSFGWANYLMRDSLKLTNQFELASVSKPITALAILKLMEEGKVDIQQNLDEFFPNFPIKGITIENLLTHRSGLSNYLYFTDELWTDKKKIMYNDDVLDLFYKHKPAPYGRPNGNYFYNNTNYMLLASLVEKISGMSFSDYMQENIFQPLGMKNTAVYSRAVYTKIPTNVVGHDKTWRRSVVQNYQDGPVGDKGIYSTVQDLYLMDINLRAGRLLKEQTLDSAYLGRSKPIKQIFNYGYGWRTFHKGKEEVVYHTGWWHGFKSLYIRDLKNEVTLVFLTNLANNSLLNLDEIYKILEMPIIRQEAYSGKGELINSKR